MIGHAVVRGPVPPLQARRRLERALTPLGNRDAGLPPDAILLVRRMAPTRRLADGFGADFTDAVSQDLQRWARGAVRPQPGVDLLRAAAVLFASRVELLATVAMLSLAGQLERCWWWRVVSEGLDRERWWQRHAVARGDLLASVLALMASWGALVPWLRERPLHESARCLVAIAEAHGFDLVQIAPALRPIHHQAPHDSRMGQGRPPPTAAEWRLSSRIPEGAALAQWPEARLLAEVALGLVRCPADLRMVLLHRAQPHGLGMDVDVRHGPAPSASPSADAGAAEGAGHPISPDAQQLPDTQSSDPRSSLPAPRPGRTRDPAGPAAAVTGRPERASSPSAADGPLVPAAPLLMTGHSIPTRYGGLFYLLNAALALGLYGDFTQPRAAGLAVNPWDLLAAIGARTFGRRFAADPLAAVLAELSGRPAGSRPPLPDDPSWLPRHMGAVQQHLMRALARRASRGIWRQVCRHEATMCTVPARVDVTLSLTALPLAIRLAGLDRDPGWLPAAGRSIFFHFEDP